MGRPFVVIGDQTDHGGLVVGASGTTDTHGKRIARVGDQVTCPKKGHGTTVIITGDPTMIIDGMPAARHGDKCACGATLIASQFVSATADGGCADPEAASAAQRVAAAQAGFLSRWLPASTSTTHDLHFLVKDDASGDPLANVPYKLTLLDGQSVTGRTNEQGMTEKIAANDAQIARIEVPYYGDGSSSTYAHNRHDTCGC